MNSTRLNAVIRQELDQHQLQISSYCMKQLEGLVGNGIKRMTMSKVADHSGYQMQAERNLRSLIEYFVKHAKQVGSFPALSDGDFDSALRTCPTLWPFSTSG